jgi:hypothetical protein
LQSVAVACLEVPCLAVAVIGAARVSCAQRQLIEEQRTSRASRPAEKARTTAPSIDELALPTRCGRSHGAMRLHHYCFDGATP